MPVIRNSFVDSFLPWVRSTIVGRIFGDSSVVIATQMFAMVVGFFYSMTTASWFGAGAQMDAFVMANTVPNYVINFVTSGFAAAMIPAFISAMRNEGHDSAQKLLSSLSLLLVAALALIGIVLILTGKYLLKIICVGFDHQTLTLATNLYYIVVPAMIFTGLIVQWSAILNALGSFAMPGIAKASQSLFGVSSVLVLGSILGVSVLAITVLLGAVLQASILGTCVVKKNISLKLNWYGLNTRAKETLKQYSSIFFGSAVLGTTAIVDQVMASSLGHGSVAALNYGNTLGLSFQGLISMALGTAILPHLSRLFCDGNIIDLRRTFGLCVLVSLALTVPLTGTLFHWSEAIVRIVYQRGSFTENDTLIVSNVQQLAVLQIPFYLIGIIGVRFLSATFQNNLLMKLGFLNTALKIGLNFLLMPRLGLPGLPLATSITQILMSGLILFLVYSFTRKAITSVH